MNTRLRALLNEGKAHSYRISDAIRGYHPRDSSRGDGFSYNWPPCYQEHFPKSLVMCYFFNASANEQTRVLTNCLVARKIGWFGDHAAGGVEKQNARRFTDEEWRQLDLVERPK